MAEGTQEVVEGQMLTLKFDVYSLLTTKEHTDFKNRGKFGASAAGSKRELQHPDALETELSGDFMPLATFGWIQRWHTLDSYSLSMYGRFLRIGLTFCNEHITDQVTTLVASRLQDEQISFIRSSSTVRQIIGPPPSASYRAQCSLQSSACGQRGRMPTRGVSFILYQSGSSTSHSVGPRRKPLWRSFWILS